MATREIFIARQPILDRKERLVAYELLFRSGATNRAVVASDVAATATVLNHVFADFGLEASLGDCDGFVNLDANMRMSDVLEMLPREKFVLEVLETVEITPGIVARCGSLKQAGFRLALDDFVSLEERHRPLLDLVDIVKIDLKALDEAGLERTLEALRPWLVKLLAEKVDTAAQAARCLDLGFHLFQGYYFARPALMAGRKLDHSELAVLRLLALILRDADASALEEVFRPEPGLAMNLLRLANSAAAGMRSPISSLAQAITLLGRGPLQRWLSLLIFSGEPGGRMPSPLMRLAASRGRFMEILSGRTAGLPARERSHAFMTGILSLMPAALRIPLGELLAQISVSEDIGAALEEHRGTLGRLLRLAESIEQDEPASCHALVAELPGIDADAVNAAAMRSARMGQRHRRARRRMTVYGLPVSRFGLRRLNPVAARMPGPAMRDQSKCGPGSVLRPGATSQCPTHSRMG